MRSLVTSCFAICAACGGGGSGDDQETRDASGVPGKTGFVQVTSRSFMASGSSFNSGTASATLFTPTACTEQVIGECSLYTCPTQFPPTTYHSAGTITITGATLPITLTPMTDMTYETYVTQALFSGGETLSASATGAGIVAFAGTVTAPARITITAPAPPSNDSITIDRAQPFHATWTGASAGKVVLRFSGPTGATLACSYAANTNTADVPASALAMVPAGLGRFDASTETLEPIDAGDWRINLQATFDAVWTDMNVVSNVDVTYQ